MRIRIDFTVSAPHMFCLCWFISVSYACLLGTILEDHSGRCLVLAAIRLDLFADEMSVHDDDDYHYVLRLYDCIL